MTAHLSPAADPRCVDRNPGGLLSLRLAVHEPDIVIAVAGELDMNNVHLLVELAEHAVTAAPDGPAGAPGPRLAIDLAGVTFMGADGVNALLRIRAGVGARAGHMVLLNPSPVVTRIVNLSRLYHHIEVSPGTGGQPPAPVTTPASDPPLGHGVEPPA